MNTSDTEVLLGILSQHGYTRTPEPLHADVVLLNTCAIRERAEQKIFCRLGELKALKSGHTDRRSGLGAEYEPCTLTAALRRRPAVPPQVLAGRRRLGLHGRAAEGEALRLQSC
jgi:hypothetical protein